MLDGVEVQSSSISSSSFSPVNTGVNVDAAGIGTSWTVSPGIVKRCTLLAYLPSLNTAVIEI